VDFLEQLQKYLSPQDFNRMQAWLAGLQSEERGELMQFILDRETRAPAVGDQAPDFDLPRLDAKGSVRLFSLRGVKPVALIFGSFT
jgi:hypothetical protein